MCMGSICRLTHLIGDLRDRHRRRCAKTFGKQRASKRKSCETCAQKKLRCSLTRPACSRCVQMGTACHYPNRSSASLIQRDQDTGPENVSYLEPTLGPTSTGLTPDVPVSAMILPEDASNSAPIIDDFAWSPTLNNINFTVDETGFYDQATWPDPASDFVDHLYSPTSFFLTPQERFKAPNSLLLPGDLIGVSLPPLSSPAGSGYREPSDSDFS